MPAAIRFLAAAAVVLSLVRLLIAAEPSSVEVHLEPRKAAWGLQETWYFDVTVKNGSQAPIDVPYLYDGVIEIDGSLYTQFPKPRIAGNPNRSIPAGAEERHGTLTLNGKAFQTVDAKTGELPLKLGAGEHTLTLILGKHQSREIKLKVAE